ncbi:MAG: hypothetical protein VW169_12940 [Rhodospirillaceae bacterium]
MIFGVGVALTAIISSATIVLGFAGYVIDLIDIPTPIIALLSVGAIGLLVQCGVTESVGVAAAITLVEIGILVAVISVGGIVSAAILAFFAVIGFEGVVNMPEETLASENTMGKAILGTLLITTVM